MGFHSTGQRTGWCWPRETQTARWPPNTLPALSSWNHYDVNFHWNRTTDTVENSPDYPCTVWTCLWEQQMKTGRFLPKIHSAEGKLYDAGAEDISSQRVRRERVRGCLSILGCACCCWGRLRFPVQLHRLALRKRPALVLCLKNSTQWLLKCKPHNSHGSWAPITHNPVYFAGVPCSSFYL